MEKRRLCHGPTFRAMLARERLRADRTGGAFSFLILDVDNQVGSSFIARELVPLLTVRLRLSDELGWFDARRIGVILPDTPADGATKLADDIRSAVEAHRVSLACEVYTYPTRPQSDTTKGPGQEDEALSVESVLAQNVPDWKRAADIVLSLGALVALAPLMLVMAAYIRLVSTGPSLFGQSRVGHRGELFTCWKFRTMHVDADPGTHDAHFTHLMKTGKPMTKLDTGHDPRIIPFGKALRSTGLDELPQLINVIRGDMSLIGPRPCIPYEFELYDPWQRKRCDVMPGITGLWQVSGKNRTTFTEMMRHDISYGRSMSLGTDLKIFMGTVPAVFAQVRDEFIDRGRRSRRAEGKTKAGAR